jgi:hypothetical protein
MDRSILNALGFHVGDEVTLLPDIKNEQVKKKVELGLDQIELVILRLARKGKKRICVNVIIRYSTS